VYCWHARNILNPGIQSLCGRLRQLKKISGVFITHIFLIPLAGGFCIFVNNYHLYLFYLNRALRISGSIFAIALLLLLLVWLLIQTPYVQNKAAQYAAYRLENLLGTRVEVGGMQLGFLNRFSLEKVMVYDRKGDTLLSVGRLKLAVTDWFLWQDTTDLKYIGLQDVGIKLQRTDSVWNHAFLAEVFAGGAKDTAKSDPIQVNLKIAEITNLRFERLDYWRGRFLHGGVKSLYVTGKTTDLENGLIELESAEVVGPQYRDLLSGRESIPWTAWQDCNRLFRIRTPSG
jgi:hypothetical protein